VAASGQPLLFGDEIGAVSVMYRPSADIHRAELVDAVRPLDTGVKGSRSIGFSTATLAGSERIKVPA